jgi:hypothetical protein
MEVQHQILTAVSAYSKAETSEHHSLSPYAAVCLGWQLFFEIITFRHLAIKDSDLDEFEKVVHGETRVHRLDYMRYIWLHILVSTYSCNECNKEEDALTISRYIPQLCKPAFMADSSPQTDR